jgi:hypothetical protein
MTEHLLNLAQQYTKLPVIRLLEIAKKISFCTENSINGCFVECGVQYGGTVCFMKAFAKSIGSTENVYAFDSFEGLPIPTEMDVSIDGMGALLLYKNGLIFEDCKIDIELFKKTEEAFNLTGEIKVFKGWFKDTLKNFPEKIAILRADGDWFESTNDIINNLYDKVVPGGFIIFDDYGYWRGCKKAVDDFLQRKHIDVEIFMTDKEEMWFRKPFF